MKFGREFKTRVRSPSEMKVFVGVAKREAKKTHCHYASIKEMSK